MAIFDGDESKKDRLNYRLLLLLLLLLLLSLFLLQPALSQSCLCPNPFIEQSDVALHCITLHGFALQRGSCTHARHARKARRVAPKRDARLDRIL
mmetsp:Transcript_2833/g.6843  ORF Transcript_2833/g.6843 Transcript_2833/m.6843 type:complete len:95 (-) Transcript_2833:353-637(-)